MTAAGGGVPQRQAAAAAGGTAEDAAPGGRGHPARAVFANRKIPLIATVHSAHGEFNGTRITADK